MKLREVLKSIEQIHLNIGSSQPYICGGIARDRYMGKKENILDLDITTGDKTIHNLAKEVSIEFQKKFDIVSRTMDDGHTSIYFGNLKIDFSSNFISPHAEQFLKEKGIENPSNLQKEMYSRDFTCNALLLNFNLQDIQDPLGVGLKDIDDKKLKTCMPAYITMSENPNRIMRAIYLSSKLNFSIDQDIKDWIANNKKNISLADISLLKKNIDRSLKYNLNNTLALFDELDLWGSIPITESLYPYFAKRSLVGANKKEAQFFRNYDYAENKTGPGTGLFSNIDKYKSVSDFRKKKMKSRKKQLKKMLKTRPK